MNRPLMSLSCLALLLAGCSGLSGKQGPDNSTESHKSYWARYEHSRAMPESKEVSAAALLGGSSEEKTVAASRAARMGPGCTAPEADSTLKLIAQLEASGKAAAARGEVNTDVVRLAERAQMLGFLRDSLYRTCERAAAGQIGKEEASAAYDKVMNSVHAIIETDRDLARKSAAEALKGLTPEQIKALQ